MYAGRCGPAENLSGKAVLTGIEWLGYTSSLLSLKLYFRIQMSKLDPGRICREMPGDSFLFGVPIS